MEGSHGCRSFRVPHQMGGQRIQPLQEHGVHGEEVTGHDGGRLPAQERPPCGASRSRRRLETVGAQDPGDGACGDLAAKAQQLPADAL